MTETTKPDPLTKLPKWAQDRMLRLARERDEAVETMRRFRDDQTVSPFYQNHWTMLDGKPEDFQSYIQANSVLCQVGDLIVEVTPNPELKLIEVRFQTEHYRRRSAIIPQASNVFTIIEIPDGSS